MNVLIFDIFMTTMMHIINIKSMELNLLILGVPMLILIAIFGYFLTRKTGPSKMQCQLVEKDKLTHDTIIFTFTIPDQKKRLGLKVGQHIQIQEMIGGEQVKRKYTPISGIDRVGSFQLLLKIYHPDEKFPNGGKMSSYLQSLPLNHKINITLPYGRFNYMGKSVAKITNFQKQVSQKKYDYFYMVAGGTGITPIFQIIQHACEHQSQEQMPNMVLLFANRTEDDILLEQQIRGYASKHKKLTVYFSVDKSITQNWKQYVGFIDENKISETAPQDIKNTLFMSCGPPILSNIVQKIWVSKMSVPIANIHRF